MSLQTWSETLITAQVDGTALTNSTTATSVIPAAAKFTLPANFYSIGKTLRVRLGFRLSTAASTPGTLTLDVRHGSTVVFNGGASGTLATSATNLTGVMDVILTCRAIGASTSANLIGTGILTSAALSAATPILLLPASAPAAGTGFDSTTSQVVDVFATFSVASASNSLTVHQYTLEAMN